MEIKVWMILAGAYIVLFVLNLRSYFFHRTLHKIHLKSGVPMNELSALVPMSYSFLGLLSKLRWVAIIALFFYNWIAAVVCLAIEFIVPIILPEQDDYKNMEKMRNKIKGDPKYFMLDMMLYGYLKD